MTAIISALNIAYEVEEPRAWWKARLVAIGLMLATSAFHGPITFQEIRARIRNPETNGPSLR
jgi:uncharacterized BrkB/YihY/UPF0761 family membrane protein